MIVGISSGAMERLKLRRFFRALNRGRFSTHKQTALLRIFLPMLLCFPLMVRAAKDEASTNAAQISKPAEIPIKYSGVRYQSGGRRDPFINPLVLKKKTKQVDDEEVARGLPPPGIAGTYIAQVTLQGITTRDSSRVAVVRGADSRAYFIREGDRLFDGYLKTIENDSITLVRETRLKSSTGRLFRLTGHSSIRHSVEKGRTMQTSKFLASICPIR